MVRKKRASSNLTRFIRESKRGSEVIKNVPEGSATVNNSISSGKKHKSRDDLDDILSHFEDSLRSVQENVLESEEEEELQAPVQAKERNNRSAVKRKPKLSWELRALREIQKYQRNTDLLIPRAAFSRLCREIFLQYCPSDLRVAKVALECLQEATEIYLVQLFEDSYLCSQHCNRKTLMARDMRLARRIGGRNGQYL